MRRWFCRQSRRFVSVCSAARGAVAQVAATVWAQGKPTGHPVRRCQRYFRLFTLPSLCPLADHATDNRRLRNLVERYSECIMGTPAV